MSALFLADKRSKQSKFSSQEKELCSLWHILMMENYEKNRLTATHNNNKDALLKQNAERRSTSPGWCHVHKANITKLSHAALGNTGICGKTRPIERMVSMHSEQQLTSWNAYVHQSWNNCRVKLRFRQTVFFFL